MRKIYLQQALSQTIQALDLKEINRDLDEFAPKNELQLLASLGIRGEFDTGSLDLSKASEKSPTTNRFYSLQVLLENGSEESRDFRQRLTSLLGIKPARRSRAATI